VAIAGLPAGNHFFAITALNSGGAESALSTIVSKTFQ
jgi:hypothetical protein